MSLPTQTEMNNKARNANSRV